MTYGPKPIDPVIRFWAKVVKSDGCWEWQGYRKKGYGHFGVHPRHIVEAHRFSWQLANGPIPEGLFVCHHCDNPPCVRPDHLFLGTNTDNLRDASRKLRLIGGDRHSWETVLAVRAAASEGLTHQKIGERVGMSQTHVSRILRGEARVHG